MAQAPSLSARRGAGVARTGETRLWWATLAVGVALCIAYAATPVEHVAVRDFVLYPLTDLIAALAVLYGVWLYRPPVPWAWLLIAVYLLFSMAGDLTWGAYEVAGQSPSPSLADVFYLAAYPCVLGGLLIAIRRRSPFRDRRELIDSAIVGVSAFLLLWVYVVNPYTVAGLSWGDALLSIAYPVADTIVLAAVVRLMLGGNWNVASLRLLFLGLVLTLAGDIAYAANNVTHIRLVDTLLQLGVVAIGLAGLHRSMPALTTRSESERPSAGGIVRLVLLAGVCAVPLIVLAIQSATGKGLHLSAVIVTTVALAALVAARSVGLATAAEQAAQREATLRRYAADLLRAEDEDHLLAVARRTVGELATEIDARIVERGASREVDDGYAFAAPVEARGELVAELVAAGNTAALDRASGALSTVAAQLSLALERDRLLRTERAAAEALARRNEELNELDRMKDIFVSGVSHELRTPLTSMIGFLELLRDGVAGEVNEKQHHFLEIVDRNCHRLNDLVDDILFMSRVDSGRLRLERASVEFTQLVADRVESIGPAAEQKGVEVQLRMDGPALSLRADQSRLAQVLDNLLSNAVKFTPEGGNVVVGVSSSHETAHLEVSDTGVGIPEDEAERLFERFFRASTAKDVSGTGLGLSIVKSIIEAHGGTISVNSRVGVGTTVAVDLPLETPPEAKVDDGAEGVAV
jgi:signal transduction histidine kinase